MESQILEELKGTKYECSKVVPLTGGTANYIYRGLLIAPLEDGTEEVAIKHGESHSAGSKTFQLPVERCEYEAHFLDSLNDFPPSSSPAWIVRPPRMLYYSHSSRTQIQEYLPSSADLKNYALRHLAAPTDPNFEPQCRALGHSLGVWLRSFHVWGFQHPKDSPFYTRARDNTAMKALKSLVNFDWLVQRVDQFPALLTEAKPVFEAVVAANKAEFADENKLQIVHGDFWTGNTILPDSPINKTSGPITVFVIDWELCHLGLPFMDLGQMIAELYMLSFFKNIDAGLWMIEGLVVGYGEAEVDDDFAFRIATQVGIHHISFGSVTPGWGTPEQVNELVAGARDIIVKGWQKDKSWFGQHPLKCLFKSFRAGAA